ncbi:DUF2490 domain-containing protein [Emticicia sp. 21SJ11W-3]|uniref:DUF2490 domain-containing protein n=1 Tax=Emticicia sp. 21SJ11W-3 TaxID=2916755 RepID=UPI00209E136F|nr:DUF2490 domain-containing protein [Emticicia sp. 21SJ11W-3]UTA66935.1 DUF2490 domain-containing protein [Emticicia sp. 21SJ11W-3]
MKKLPLILIISLVFTQTYSQKEYQHNIVWGRLVLTDTISKKLRWEVYLQHRRQNTQQTNWDVLAQSQFTSYWLWLHYNLTPNVRLSLSPIGYFKSWVLINQPSDLEKEPVNEWRVSGRIEQEVKGKFFNTYNRYGLEYRQRDLLNNGIFRPNFRVRYMLRFEKPITFSFLKKPLTTVVNDEIFIQFGKAVKGNPNIFDQNRLYAGLNYPFNKYLKGSLGYVWGIQSRISGKEIDYYNFLWGILTIDNLSAVFKKNRYN